MSIGLERLRGPRSGVSPSRVRKRAKELFFRKYVKKVLEFFKLRMYDLSMGNRMENLHFTVERMRQMGSGFMAFQPFSIIFFVVFGLIAFVIIMGIVKSISAGLSNQAAEQVQRSCKVVDKRTRVRGGSGNFSASTDYYITFEFDRGERKELEVKDTDFGMIVIGDRGEVHYKGTRFLEFVRLMGA